MKKGAIISDCETYRYRLWRIWNENAAKIMWIMLNPSTANAEEDDPTIRRCIGFARNWGYGGIYVENLYAYRSTDPKELKTAADPEGPANRDHLISMMNDSEKIICAWGNKQGPPPKWLKGIQPLCHLGNAKTDPRSIHYTCRRN